ncbi:unnamed protein product, partial [Medioppia subpectinata]
MKSPQLQYQKQSKITDNESDSLPIPWIAAIIINAILVFLFILFVVYCYWKSKKRRQRIRNPDKESLFSGKSSKHSVQEVQKNVIDSKTEATKENIFNIESEHKRLTESDINEESVDESVDNTRKTSIKSPMTKVQSITRLSGGGRGSVHEINGNQYNPTDSPSVSKFTDKLNDSVPNQPQYKAKHEEQDNHMLETVTEIDEHSDYDRKSLEQKHSKHSSPSKSRKSSPTHQMPSSNASITTASNVMTKVKGLGHSSPKGVSPERQVRSPGSPQSSSHSTAVQTSPSKESWANIPGAIIDDNDRYFDERDVNPFTKKECIGRITLPARQRMTLEQLRNYLLQSNDETIRNCAKRKFKFLSESYRLVVMDESFTPVDQIYQTQGIFIKFNAGTESVPFGYRSQNKIRAANRFATGNNDNDNNRLQVNTISRANTRTSQKSDSIYGSTPKSVARKSSIYGSSYGSTPRNNPNASVYGSTAKSSDKTRFGFQRNANQYEERSYAMDRTPRRRDDNRVRNCAKRKFKFLSESYRLVVMDESFTPVDQIYQTQGIFIKFNAGTESVPFGYRSQNKIRAANRFATGNNDNDNNRLQVNTISRANTRTSQKSDSIYGSTPKSVARKSSIYGSSYGSTPRNNPNASVYGSTAKSSDKTRFGFQRNANQYEERSYAMDRTPRRRDDNRGNGMGYSSSRNNLIASPLSLTPTPMVSPLVSPRTRIRLCRKLQLQSQVQSGQLEEMPNFFTLYIKLTTSLDSLCDNPGCNNQPLLKCYVCSKVKYCSLDCKKEHSREHRFICK